MISVEHERRTLSRPEDLHYAQAQYRIIAQADPCLPAPAYYDAEGHAYVPHDYEQQETQRERFIARAKAEAARLRAPYAEQWFEEAWESYRAGIYGICLRKAAPETIVQKNALIDAIEAALAAPHPEDRQWLAVLRANVDELDSLERPFCSFDREYFGGTVSRDRCITAVRERYL